LTWQKTVAKFYNDPFGFVDNLRPNIKGHVFNPFAKFRFNRRLAFLVAIFGGLLPWVLFGFDSCIAQPFMCMYKLPEVFGGKMAWTELADLWNYYYGKEFHYSAILIYGLMFWALSRHYDYKFGIVKSKNIGYALGWTLLSIAIFEFTWMGLYARVQFQPWVTQFQFPQLKIINQNIYFTLLGVLTILYMYVDSHILWKPPGVSDLKQN